MPKKRRKNKKADRQRDLLAVGHRRILWLGVLGLLAWSGMVVRLVQVQAVERGLYGDKAQKQHQRPQVLQASRGSLLDRWGNELALDMAATTFWVRPGGVKQPEAVARHFAPYSRYDYKTLLRKLSSRDKFVHLARPDPLD